MSKQTATFTSVLGWFDGNGLQVSLGGVVHPRLGNEESVTTSTIVRVDFADDGSPLEIETRNTVYVRTGMEHAP